MQLLLPEAPISTALARRSKSTSTCAAGRVRAGTTTFYDTFDGRLHGEGLTLRHRDATLILTDRATGDDARLRRGQGRARGCSTTTSRDALRERSRT